jgi:anti-anti-sigma factor
VRTRKFAGRVRRRPKAPEKSKQALGIAISTSGGRTRVTVAGELDLVSAALLAGRLEEAEKSRPEVIEVDLRGLTFLDSSGLAVLFAANRRARQAGRRLVLLKGHGPIDRVFALAQVEDVIDTVEEPTRR